MLDEQKSVVDKEACELRASLREVEQARVQARRDVHDLRRQLKNVDAERCRLSHELGELQVRVTRLDEQTESTRREHCQLRQKVATDVDELRRD